MKSKRKDSKLDRCLELQEPEAATVVNPRVRVATVANREPELAMVKSWIVVWNCKKPRLRRS